MTSGMRRRNILARDAHPPAFRRIIASVEMPIVTNSNGKSFIKIIL